MDELKEQKKKKKHPLKFIDGYEGLREEGVSVP